MSAKDKWTLEAINDSGERITHLYPNDCYYAHLSIYHFALQFCQHSKVLDAGSGAGYGSAYLAQYGAEAVWGLDASQKAIDFSRDFFPLYNLHFQQMDLGNIVGFPENFFDLLYSSNVLEHIYDIHRFFHQASQLLTHNGTAIIAVPPITNHALRQLNIENPYHLNIWTPKQWLHTLQHYFEEVHIHSHTTSRDDYHGNFFNTPQETTLSEKDFSFPQIDLKHLYCNNILTVVFVAHKPRKYPSITQPNPIFIDDSFTRLPSIISTPEPQPKINETEQLIAQLQQYDHYIANLEHNIDQKNQHIQNLEKYIQRLESGKLIRISNIFSNTIRKLFNL